MRILIAGAGRFGRELACWMRNEVDGAVYFIDDTDARPNPDEYPEVIGKIDEFETLLSDRVVISVGDPVGKLHIATRLRAREIKLGRFRDCTSVVAITARVSPHGVILCPYSLVSADAVVDDLVTINTFSSIGHDAVIGEGCTLSSHVDICGRVKVGRGVFFGSGARVLPNLTVGDGAIVGAGAVVVRNVPPGVTVFGNPAIIVRASCEQP